MMTEPYLLISTALLAFFSFVPAIVALAIRGGVLSLFGNRGDTPELPEWGNRALRAQRNMLDNVGPFALIVVAAQMVGVSNDQTLHGMTLFFWGRIGHLLVYIVGIPYLRTVAFAVSVGGLFEIARETVAGM